MREGPTLEPTRRSWDRDRNAAKARPSGLERARIRAPWAKSLPPTAPARTLLYPLADSGLATLENEGRGRRKEEGRGGGDDRGGTRGGAEPSAALSPQRPRRAATAAETGRNHAARLAPSRLGAPLRSPPLGPDAPPLRPLGLPSPAPRLRCDRHLYITLRQPNTHGPLSCATDTHRPTARHRVNRGTLPSYLRGPASLGTETLLLTSRHLRGRAEEVRWLPGRTRAHTRTTPKPRRAQDPCRRTGGAATGPRVQGRAGRGPRPAAPTLPPISPPSDPDPTADDRRPPGAGHIPSEASSDGPTSDPGRGPPPPGRSRRTHAPRRHCRPAEAEQVQPIQLTWLKSPYFTPRPYGASPYTVRPVTPTRFPDWNGDPRDRHGGRGEIVDVKDSQHPTEPPNPIGGSQPRLSGASRRRGGSPGLHLTPDL